MSWQPVTNADGERVRLLVVEDDPADEDLIRRVFSEAEHPGAPIEIHVVGDANAALEALRESSFTLVVSDYSLPGVDGLEFLRRLRRDRIRIPVVIMTGVGDEVLAVRALQSGAADYVVKEVGFERGLPIAIRRVLDRRANEMRIELARRQLAEHANRLELQIQEQALSLHMALREAEALRQVGHALSSARELQPALELVSRMMAQIVDAQVAAILIQSGEDLVLASFWGKSEHPVGWKDSRLIEIMSEGWGHVTTVPLRDADAQIGSFLVARSRPQPFSARQIDLLQSLADMTGLTIGRVRAHELLRRRRVDEPEPGPAAGSEPLERTEAAKPDPPPPGRVGFRNLDVPPFPAALQRLLQLADDPEASTDDVADAVSLDPVLASATMQLASSPIMGRLRPPSSLHEALVVIGLRGIRNLAFSQFSRGFQARSGPIDGLLWEQSLATATVAQLLVELLKPALADDAYLCGLLRNVGAVAINRSHPEQYREVLAKALSDGCSILDAERDRFGSDSSALVERIVGSWGLPPGILQTVRRSTRADAASNPVTASLAWASVAGLRLSPRWRELLGQRTEPTWLQRDLDALAPGLSLPASTLDEVLDASAARCETLRSLIA